MYTIYKATNLVNIKSYVGIDSYWPHRKSDHKRNALVYNTKGAFYDAIRKYGWESFEWCILEQHTDYQLALNEAEPRLIMEHGGYTNGYNMTYGGEGCKGRIVSPEVRKSVSERMKVQLRTPESNMLRSEKLKGIKRESFTSEHKQKLIKAHVKHYIVTFPNGSIENVCNMAEFCRQHNLDKASMSAVALGYRNVKQHKGFKCKIV